MKAMIDSLCPGSIIFSLLFQSQGRPSPRNFHGSGRPCSGATTRQGENSPRLGGSKGGQLPEGKSSDHLAKNFS
jgi:hypothetical protein